MSKTKLTAIVYVILSLTVVGSNFVVPNFRGFDDSLFPVSQPDALLVPAPYAFTIWAVIYLWLIVSAVWGLLKKSDDREFHAMRIPLLVSPGAGTFWLPVATTNPIASTVMICVMLIGAVFAVYKSPQYHAKFAALPVGLYAGWLSAASCVSVGVVLVGYGILAETLGAYIFITLASIIGFTVQYTLNRAPSYGIAVIWALVALVVGTYDVNATVSYLAGAGSIAMLYPTFKAFRSR